MSQVSQAASLQRFSVAEQVNVGYVFELWQRDAVANHVLYETLDPLRIELAFNPVSRRRGAGSDFAVVGFVA